MNEYRVTDTSIRNLKLQKKKVSVFLPEKSISGNMASSGKFINAVHTFSSNNFTTAKQQNNMFFSMKADFFYVTKTSSTLQYSVRFWNFLASEFLCSLA